MKPFFELWVTDKIEERSSQLRRESLKKKKTRFEPLHHRVQVRAR